MQRLSSIWLGILFVALVPIALVNASSSNDVLTPLYPVITAANANGVDQIAQFGIGGGAHAQFAWSPDGKELLVSHLGGTYVYSLSNLTTPLYALSYPVDTIRKV